MTTRALPPTRRDLSWLDDHDFSGTSYEVYEGCVWAKARVAYFIDVVHEGTEGSAAFFAEEGDQPTYRAWAVLDWLNY